MYAIESGDHQLNIVKAKREGPIGEPPMDGFEVTIRFNKGTGRSLTIFVPAASFEEMINHLHEKFAPEAEAPKEEPPSLAAARALRSGNASDWSPRDVITFFLREIDTGEVSPSSVTIVFSEPTGKNTTRTGFRMAGPSVLENLGGIEIAKHKIFHNN
jgi:hypothetical protein